VPSGLTTINREMIAGLAARQPPLATNSRIDLPGQRSMPAWRAHRDAAGLLCMWNRSPQRRPWRRDQKSERSVEMGKWRIIPALCRPLDHRTPAGGFLAHERIVPSGCATHDVRALLGEALADVRHVQDFDEFSVEPLHD
jgi:hypothetical protein